MGNALTVSPCLMQTRCLGSSPSSSRTTVKLIFFDGTTTTLKGKHIAGEIMFENPDKMVCHADSFFIGHPLPALAIDDELQPGQTYFVLPIDRFSSSVLSAASLSALSSSPKPCPLNFGDCPFQYVKAQNGTVLIKVLPEFITGLINRGKEEILSTSFLCSTPELKKHYDQLVGSKDQTWSPRLETISEHKSRYSPCRFLGLQWKQNEN